MMLRIVRLKEAAPIHQTGEKDKIFLISLTSSCMRGATLKPASSQHSSEPEVT
jgi:hypothetical protein